MIWSPENKERARRFIKANRLPKLMPGWIALGIDPAVNHTGLSWYFGGIKSGTGTLKSLAFPSGELKNRMRDVLFVRPVSRALLIVEGTPKSHVNNGVDRLVRSAKAVLPPDSVIRYVPPTRWQRELLTRGGGPIKQRACEFAIATPEIHWSKARIKQWLDKQENDASDAACLLFYSLVCTRLPSEAVREFGAPWEQGQNGQ